MKNKKQLERKISREVSKRGKDRSNLLTQIYAYISLSDSKYTYGELPNLEKIDKKFFVPIEHTNCTYPLYIWLAEIDNPKVRKLICIACNYTFDLNSEVIINKKQLEQIKEKIKEIKK